MSATSILDNFPQALAPSRSHKIQRIFTGIELALWAFCGMGYLLKMAGFAGYYYFLLPGFGLLALLYLLCPIWLFGSVGWRRHIGSHLTGIALAGSFLPILFVIERWPMADIQTQNGLKISTVTSVGALLFYFLRKSSPRGNTFFLRILVRTVLAMVIMAVLVR